MTKYETIDYLPKLAPDRMASAIPLTFNVYEYPLSGENLTGWDNNATSYTSEEYALLQSVFIFTGREGATYDLYSHSFFDPYILEVFDSEGRVISVDDGSGNYGTDHLTFQAPYTGTFFAEASWNQGLASDHRFVSFSIYEDVDTIPKAPPVATEIPLETTPSAELIPPSTEDDPRSDADIIFDYGENLYPDLFPNHPESINIFGYHARVYSNGNALGQKDDGIYFYDGSEQGSDEIVFVGSESSYLSQAISAGFG